VRHHLTVTGPPLRDQDRVMALCLGQLAHALVKPARGRSHGTGSSAQVFHAGRPRPRSTPAPAAGSCSISSSASALAADRVCTSARLLLHGWPSLRVVIPGEISDSPRRCLRRRVQTGHLARHQAELVQHGGQVEVGASLDDLAVTHLETVAEVDLDLLAGRRESSPSARSAGRCACRARRTPSAPSRRRRTG